MELTDDIRKHVFKDSIKQELRKKSQEYYVLALLKHYLPQIGQTLHCADSPDLQDDNGLIGIEVTEAVSPRERQISGEFIKLHKTTDPKKNELSKSIIIRNGGTLSPISVSFPMVTTDTLKENIKNIVRKKLKKLQEYPPFQGIGLAILIDFPIVDDIHKEWYKWVMAEQDVEQSNSLNKYAFSLLICWDNLSYYDFRTNESVNIKIDDTSYQGLKKLARMTAEGLVKEDDPIWL